MTKSTAYSDPTGAPAHSARGSDFIKAQQQRIVVSLRAVGANKFDLLLPETRNLYLVIEPFEEIVGAAYGRYKQERPGQPPLMGRGLLVATDKRILFLDKKPLFMRSSDISYSVVSGITYTKVGFSGKISLYNKTGDIRLRTFNQTCAHHFLKAVEQRLYSLPG